MSLQKETPTRNRQNDVPGQLDQIDDSFKTKYPVQYYMNWCWAVALEMKDSYSEVRDKDHPEADEDSKSSDSPQHPFSTHLGALADAAWHILSNGRPAKAWTVGSPDHKDANRGFANKESDLGPCPFLYDDADILVLTPEEYKDWCMNKNPPKLVLVRRHVDPLPGAWKNRTTDSLYLELEGHRKKKGKHPIMIDVQMLTNPASETAVEKQSPAEVLQRMRAYKPDQPFSVDNCPVNLLSLGHYPKRDMSVPRPWPTGGRFDLLPLVLSMDPNPDDDLESSQQFRIKADRGAVSSWHMDQNGTWGAITLLPKTDKLDLTRSIKLWPVYPTHRMTAEYAKQVRRGFAAEGTGWRPVPQGKIPAIGIMEGDTLIQPPFTIHAPITVTESYMEGAMAWGNTADDIMNSMEAWKFTSRFPATTNEPPYMGTEHFLTALRGILSNPEERKRHNVAVDWDDAKLAEFDECRDAIIRHTQRYWAKKEKADNL